MFGAGRPFSVRAPAEWPQAAWANSSGRSRPARIRGLSAYTGPGSRKRTTPPFTALQHRELLELLEGFDADLKSIVTLNDGAPARPGSGRSLSAT